MNSLTKNIHAVGVQLCSYTAILCICFTGLLFPSAGLTAQSYDLLLQGGNLIDPRNDIEEKMDIAIKDGKIAAVQASIPASSAKQVIDVQGLTVTPGLIDIHGHHFWGTRPDAYLSNSYASLPPDGFSLPAGVTTVVDAGCAGWRNFKIFKTQTIDRSKTRVLAFINIIGGGMAGGAVEQNLGDMDPKLTAMEARRYADHIVGVKLAHYSGEDWTPTERAVEAGRQANLGLRRQRGRHPRRRARLRLLHRVDRPRRRYRDGPGLRDRRRHPARRGELGLGFGWAVQPATAGGPAGSGRLPTQG